jgi:hypothetical protein
MLMQQLGNDRNFTLCFHPVAREWIGADLLLKLRMPDKHLHSLTWCATQQPAVLLDTMNCG